MNDRDELNEMEQGLIAHAKNGSINRINNLMEEGATLFNVKEEMLHASASNGRLEVVKFLEEKYGEDLYEDYPKKNAFTDAAGNGKNNILSYYIDQGFDVKTEGYNALIQSSRNGHLNTVKFLFESGMESSNKNNDAIKWAAHHGKLDVVDFLAAHGADMNIAKEQIKNHAQQNVKDMFAEAERKKFADRLAKSLPQAKKPSNNKMKI